MTQDDILEMARSAGLTDGMELQHEIDDGDWLLNSYQTVVTHWQPMPEPPKKGGVA